MERRSQRPAPRAKPRAPLRLPLPRALRVSSMLPLLPPTVLVSLLLIRRVPLRVVRQTTTHLAPPKWPTLRVLPRAPKAGTMRLAPRRVLTLPSQLFRALRKATMAPHLLRFPTLRSTLVLDTLSHINPGPLLSPILQLPQGTTRMLAL